MALRQKPKTESPPKEQTSAVPEELTRAVEMTYKPTTIKLSEIDDETKRPIFFHREKEVLAWSEEEEHESYLRSLAESLIKEGQITPIEFYRDEEGRPILVRGYLTVEAHRQIIARKLDPTHFHTDMEIKAAEISGGLESDYLVRAVASNEVRRHLSDEAKSTVAAMMLKQGVPATRAARALGISATHFGRYLRRHNNDWMMKHVRDKHLTMTDADNLLEAASKVGRIKEIEEDVAAIVAAVKAHITQARIKAATAQEKFDEEKNGIVRDYIEPAQVKKWIESIEAGRRITISLDEEPEDWTYTCKVEKDGKIKIANLSTNLHQMSYEHIGQLAAKLSLVAGIVEQVWLSKKAQDTLGAMTQGDEADLLPFFKKHKADKIVETIRAKVAAAMGEADPKHGKSTPRRERSIADYIDVRPVPPDANPEDEEHEYDAAIDGGLTNGPQARR